MKVVLKFDSEFSLRVKLLATKLAPKFPFARKKNQQLIIIFDF